MEEKTDWTIVFSWPKRSDDDEDDGSRTKTKDYGRTGPGVTNPSANHRRNLCSQWKELGYAGSLVNRLSGNDSRKRVCLRSAAACRGMP